MSQNLLIENGGRITLPEDLIDRYRLDEDTPLRVIETRNGILLVPLTDQPMDDALRAELEAWQALGAESFEMFPFEDSEK
jgi:bifunctional DNA-binding transcriptional regulator/antitoxin component of YhaV-PrlF toxin-antitoxin module